MFSQEGHPAAHGGGLFLRAGALASAFCLSFLAAGCNAGINQHATALAAATAPVVDQAAEAYRQAQAIHAQSVDYDAAAAFDQNNVFAPASIQDWPAEKDIQIRLAVLTAFQLYVKELEQITAGTDSPALDAASKSVGENLSTLANTLAPTGTTTTTSTSTSSTLPPLISSGVQNAISTAIDALGQFLVNRTINKELPQQIEAMDPHVQALCGLLAKDIELIQEQEKIDSNDVIDKQTAFLREAKLDPEERRVEFMKLPEMARRQAANDQALTELHAAIVNLMMTHHALAAAAQGNNPESFTQKLKDLGAAGSSLGKFYSSLPAAQ